MEWRHNEVRAAGAAILVDRDGLPVTATYKMGIVSTGRSRVFAGHFVKLVLASETEFTGEDEHSMRSALWRLASNLSSVKLELRCSGLDERWWESGLSANTGWGYFATYPKAVHMMTQVQEQVEQETSALDREIKEAVSGMRVGRQH